VALIHVNVVDVVSGSVVRDRSVILDGDRIVAVTAAITAADASPATAKIVDGHGKWLIPGLWDMHVHFGDPQSGRLFIANGVTGVRVMWGNPSYDGTPNHVHYELRDAFDKGDRVGPRMVIGSNIFDGPKPVWPNSLALTTPAEGRAAVEAAKKDGADFIKVYSLLPRDVFLAIAAASKQAGLPFVGHVPESVSASEASDAGQKSMEHLYGLFRAISAHETTLLKEREHFLAKPHTPSERKAFNRKQTAETVATWDEAKAQALFTKLKANGSWQTPTLTVLWNIATVVEPEHASDPRMKYVSPFIKAFWNPKEDFRFKDRKPEDYAFAKELFTKQLQLVGKLNQAGVPLLAGTDEMNPFCFPGFSLHDELAFLVKAGLSPLEVLRTATLGPARFFDREATMGSVAPGKVADLVLLDGDPLADIANTRKVALVVSRGRIYDRGAIDKLLDEAAAAASPSAPPALGLISDFDDGTTAVRFGAGWSTSTDAIAGGKATATLTPVGEGAHGSKGALAVRGTIPAGDIPQAWAGAQLWPGAARFQPADLSRCKGLAFYARGDGKRYTVALFTQRTGFRPLVQEFTAGATWQRFHFPFAAFANSDGKDVTAIVFMGGSAPGDISFSLDDVACE
jgi:imidazolonepropionase-like amidohydrolase